MKNRKISTTAYIIVDSISKLSQMSSWSEYVPNPMGDLNLIFAGNIKDAFIKRFINMLPLRVSILIMDVFYIPGMTYHYLFRKLLIEKQLRKAVQRDFQQVIILGGGFDTLAIRMAAIFPEVNFFEIDLPDTQNAKINIFNKVGHIIPKNCIFKPADLSNTRLEAILASTEFSSKKPTLVILEGVLMYLGEAEVKTLFSDLYSLIKSRLTVIFGAMTTSDYSKNWRVRLINWLLKRGQESTKWSCLSADMPKFVANLGYKLQEWIPYKKLQSFYRNPHEIEHLPDEDENYYIVDKNWESKTTEGYISISDTPIISCNN